MIAKLFLLLPLSIIICECANILGIVPTPSYSHQIAYANIWKELSLKGHKVTVLTTNPQNNSDLTNLTEIDLSAGYHYIEKQHGWYRQNAGGQSLKIANLVFQLTQELAEFYLGFPDVQKLINDKSLEFDVVMVESVFSEFLIFGERFDAPTIMLLSLELPYVINKAFQNDYHPLVYPDSNLPYVGELSFKERVITTVLDMLISYIRSLYWPARQNTVDKYFEDNSLPINLLMQKSSLFFVSVSPVLLYPRALTPRTIVIGGGTTIMEPKELSKDIQQFLDSALNGVIYFSLGSNAKCENFGNDVVNGIIEVLKELPFSVLWKFDGTGFKIPSNVKTFTWISQQDVLRHPNVKLFITQGGMQSLEEALYFEKPIVGIPIFGDQFGNIKKLVLKGVAKLVSAKPYLDPLVLKDAIFEVLQNASYSENIKKLNAVNLDQPMTGLEKAVWWTEYVIRHKGNVDHLIHSPARTIPFYQYYFLDVFLFFFVTVVFILGIFYLLFVYLLKSLLWIFREKKLENKKKS